jgi:hypothetical protein
VSAPGTAPPPPSSEATLPPPPGVPSSGDHNSVG